MAVFNQPDYDNHEQIVFCEDKQSGLKAIIAVHNTKLGPGVGGCRLYNYANDDDALTDVLRLSRGMTYKNALAGLPLGGGKSVIIGDPKTVKSDELFQAFGRILESLSGKYISAEDMNITTDDIDVIGRETNFVAGMKGKSGNPAPFTALGTFLGIKAAVKHQMGRDDLEGITVSIQGLGSVGFYLCEHLHNAGAKIVATDINQDSLAKAQELFGAKIVGLDEIYSEDVDVYAPCALGATINDNTVDKLKATIVAGCANNQLAESRHGEVLRQKGILYAPDYVINAGGIINVSSELDPEGYSEEKSTEKVNQIFNTLLDIFARAEESGKPTDVVADEMARTLIA